jgi:hypothetical protein
MYNVVDVSTVTGKVKTTEPFPLGMKNEEEEKSRHFVDVLMRAYFKQLHPCQPPVTIRFLSEAET